jgi:hypothetical protein
MLARKAPKRFPPVVIDTAGSLRLKVYRASESEKRIPLYPESASGNDIISCDTKIKGKGRVAGTVAASPRSPCGVSTKSA